MKATSVTDIFSKMNDPRVEGRTEHKLTDIIAITLASVLCGAESWNEIEMFGQAKEDWFRTFLELPSGIPSHDTFNRFFALLDPASFENCFREWAGSFSELADGQIISVDGKTLRGAKGAGSRSYVHMVSAWVGENSTLLGQLKVDEKSNEITAIPKLLDALMIKGALITIDAMGCQKDIARSIVDGGGNYILAVKGNQESLLDDIQASFRMMPPAEKVETLDFGHGRIETRRCSIITDLGLMEDAESWQSLSTVVRVNSERYIKSTGEVQTSTRFYISSLKADADTFMRAIRHHWSIENGLHWALDVSFHEDDQRKRAGNAAQNFSIVNRIALTALKQDKLVKLGIKSKRLNAGWNHNYLRALLKF